MPYPREETLYTLTDDAIYLFCQALRDDKTVLRTADIQSARNAFRQLFALAKESDIIADYDERKLDELLWSKQELYVAEEQLKQAILLIQADKWVRLDCTRFSTCWYQELPEHRLILCCIYKADEKYEQDLPAYSVYARVFPVAGQNPAQEAAAELFRQLYHVGLFQKGFDAFEPALQYAYDFMQSKNDSP